MAIIFKDTYLKAGVLSYFASKDTEKKLAFSWLVAMTIAAERVAPSAMSRTRRRHRLLVLAMDDSLMCIGKWDSKVEI